MVGVVVQSFYVPSMLTADRAYGDYNSRAASRFHPIPAEEDGDGSVEQAEEAVATALKTKEIRRRRTREVFCKKDKNIKGAEDIG